MLCGWFKVPHDKCCQLQEMQKCFDDKDIGMLQEVISKMDPTVSSFVKASLLSDESLLGIMFFGYLTVISVYRC